MVVRFHTACLIALLVVLVTCSQGRIAVAQSTFGSIRGTAQDASGAAIPDTQVILHSVAENMDRAVRSDATGAFAFTK